ncbi:hypothetical protein ACHQM5_003311 [Ranunculus cassubicifolius]
MFLYTQGLLKAKEDNLQPLLVQTDSTFVYKALVMGGTVPWHLKSLLEDCKFLISSMVVEVKVVVREQNQVADELAKRGLMKSVTECWFSTPDTRLQWMLSDDANGRIIVQNLFLKSVCFFVWLFLQ